MAITNIKGRDMGLYIKRGAEHIRIGCSDSISLKVDTEEVETSCVASGNFKEFEPGDISWSLDVDGAIRQATDAAGPPAQTDATDNVTAESLLDYQLAGTILVARFSLGIGVGTARYEGNVFPTSNSLSGSRKEAGKFSTSLRGSGPLTKTIQA